MQEALFFERLPGQAVRCGLCRFRCLITPGRRGICRVRENRDGTLYTLVYAKAIAEQVDPVEKKPLFHFQPGSLTYSVATMGCNFRCRHCQNYSISQVPSESAPITGKTLTPEQIVARALASGCRSISYTYTEPTIFFEYAFDTAVLARQAGLKNIFVTNGYITPEALALIAPWLDAANIDLKGFSEKFYQEVVGASLAEVLATICDYRRHGIWIELTTLLIPGLNDDEAELHRLATFIADQVGVDTPWHVSRYYPQYLLTDRSPTAVATIRRAVAIGHEAGLSHVYSGNIPGDDGEQTRCPSCQKVLINREGFRITANRLQNGCCPDCHLLVAGVGL
jgi:pyruvate formate lyase activating enzyme